MSSFVTPHKMFLFNMRKGTKKVGYGTTPQEAYENLRFRLSEAEMKEVLFEEYLVIDQREFRKHIQELG